MKQLLPYLYIDRLDLHNNFICSCRSQLNHLTFEFLCIFLSVNLSYSKVETCIQSRQLLRRTTYSQYRQKKLLCKESTVNQVLLLSQDFTKIFPGYHCGETEEVPDEQVPNKWDFIVHISYKIVNLFHSFYELSKSLLYKISNFCSFYCSLTSLT